jgi:sialic acid synthase SpsE
MKIGTRLVGPEYPPLVIAEIGINHGGSLKVAKEMVDAAKEAGVEVVKHQTHIIEDEMSSEAKSIKPGNSDETIFNIMKSCALDEQQETELARYIESKGMIFMSSPFSRAAVERLERIGIPAFKIGSGECNNYPLLKHIASKGKPVILSTGMNTIKSISKAVKIFVEANVDLAILHTTNLYPTPNHLVRLNAMVEMHKAFPNLVFGLSDHTLTNHACFGAVALGASILERHFTDHMQRTGPDIICSMDKTSCTDLISGSEIIWSQLRGKKEATLEEKVTIDFAFASVVTINEIKKGELFTTENLWVKRPGTGDFLADDYEHILGKTASRNIPSNVQLKKNDIG